MKKSKRSTINEYLKLEKVRAGVIKILREAGVDGIEDEDEFEEQPPATAPPEKAQAPASPQSDPGMAEPAPEAEPTPEPASAAVAEPSPEITPDNNPKADVPSEPVAAEPDATPDDKNQKLQKAKVKLFFDKLEGSEGLMNYLQFSNPLEQAEAIVRFANLVGVPEGQLMSVLTNLRKMSKAKAEDEVPVV